LLLLKEIKIIKETIFLKKIFFILKDLLLYAIPLSLLLALLSSSYSEIWQQHFFASVKNLFTIGQPSVYKKIDGIRLKFHFGELRHNPVGIAQQVLRYSEEQLIRDSGLSITPYSIMLLNDESVLQIADFFINHYEVEQINGIEVLRLPYLFDYPFYALSSPWYSGMAQGHAMIVLLHAYKISSENRYLSYAEKLFNVLKIPIADGGVLVKNKRNNIIFEEYADSSQDMSNSPKVLNGNIYAIDGLFWFWYMTGSEDAKQLLINSIVSMNEMLPEYNAMFWSYYDTRGNYANASYHKVHLRQINRLKEYAEYLKIEDVANLESVFERWKTNEMFPFMGYAERMLFNRNRMLYVIYFSNLVIFIALIILPISIWRFYIL